MAVLPRDSIFASNIGWCAIMGSLIHSWKTVALVSILYLFFIISSLLLILMIIVTYEMSLIQLLGLWAFLFFLMGLSRLFDRWLEHIGC